MTIPSGRFTDQIFSHESQKINESSNIISRKPLKQVLLPWIELASVEVSTELIGYDLGMVSTNGWLKLVNWLVVEPTHLKNMRKSNWVHLPQTGVKIKDIWNHHLVNVGYPKNHGISKLVVWRSQTPAIHIQTPLFCRVQWFLGYTVT